MPTYRVDRHAWARAIKAERNRWDYYGIDQHERRRDDHCLHETLGEALVGSSRYMDDYCENELKFRMSSDCDDEWEERCLDRLGPKPTAPPEAVEFYEEKWKALHDSETKRYEYFSENMGFDMSWHWDQIKEEATDTWFIVHMLKTYPVRGVERRSSNEVVKLEDLEGYCPECDEPMVLGDKTLNNELKFEWCCPNCDWKMRNITGFAQKFIQQHGRPFDWPPGAPYPPRRHFNGRGYEAPFYEE